MVVYMYLNFTVCAQCSLFRLKSLRFRGRAIREGNRIRACSDRQADTIVQEKIR